ncbi:MAG TPA: response regulator, partial [Accumulibacter sp.]|nr:response regulator [Accumulibacter sp.]
EAAEDAARRDAERKAAEDAARREAERKAAEDAARRDAERKATEDAARHEAARREAERERVEEARRANERQAAEDAARRAAERTVREQAARQDALPKTADETTRQETERQPVAGPERVVAERTTIEQLAARRRSAEDALRRDAERLEIDRRAIEQAVRSEEDERQAVEKAIAEEQRKRSISSAPQQPARKAKLPEETIVMIADDSRVVRVKTSRLLTANQYRVAAAEDGVDAARQIEASPPDVLVTDVDMPGLNGFQLAKMVRDNPRTAKLPIIMVTSDNEQLRAEAARIGVNVVLGKPYPEEQLIAHIQQLMDGQAGI